MSVADAAGRRPAIARDRPKLEPRVSRKRSTCWRRRRTASTPRELGRRGHRAGDAEAAGRSSAWSRSRGAASSAIRSSMPARRCGRAGRRSSSRPSSAAAFDRLHALAPAGRVRDGAAARRHRQRQDRALSAAGARRCAAAGRGVLLLVPEIALTPAVAGVVPRARSAIASPSSTAACPTASATISGSASAAATSTSSSARARRCSRRVAAPRPDHRGRGARRLVQAGGEPALSRPRRRGRARAGEPARWSCSAPPRRRSRASQRAERPLRADHARAARARPADGGGARSSTCAQEYADAGPGRDPQRGRSRRRSSERLERREQAIVLLNRRGFATVVFCRQCGQTLECPTAACR